MHLIDCQSHIFPQDYAKLLAKNKGYVRIRNEGERYLVVFGSDHTLAIRPADYAIEKKITEMDACGIAISIIGPNIPGPEMLDEKLKVPAARMLNDYTAHICSMYPGKFFGLAVLPFSSPKESLTEYERAVHTLGLRGVLLFSHLSTMQVDDPSLEVIYEAASRDGVPLVLHPTVPQWADSIRDYAMIPMMGFMVDHSFAMLRLILSGVLERHTALKILQPHCGGILPYLLPRIDEQTEVKRRGRDHIVKAPSEYYRNVYLDIVSPSARTARFAFETMGVDHMVFGSDHPWIAIQDMVAVLADMQLTSDEQQKVASENAARLFSL